MRCYTALVIKTRAVRDAARLTNLPMNGKVALPRDDDLSPTQPELTWAFFIFPKSSNTSPA